MDYKKVQKRKFIRNAVIVTISLAIVAFVLNIAPGYQRDKSEDKINLVINQYNVTDNLIKDIYVNDKGTIYLSEEDVHDLFDNTIYYDERYNEVITTSNTKVASMVINQKQMTVNGTDVTISDPAIKKNGAIYIPISEMELVYNLEIEYIKDSNTAVIDELYKGMIVANISKNTELKYKPRELSKDVAKLKQGERVYCFYTTSKGWRQIRTENGAVRIH